jgi:hypothetical protein
MIADNDRAFSALSALMQDTWKNAPDVWKAYTKFEQARQSLDDAAAGIGLAHDRMANDPYIPAEHKREVIDNHRYLFEAAEKEAPDRMRLALQEVRATAQAAIEADMAPSDNDARRTIIRQDIDMAVAGKQSKFQTLIALAQSDPARYAGEVATYGKALLQRDEPHMVRMLLPAVAAVTPMQTPRGQAAYRILASLDSNKVEGRLAGVMLAARRKVEAVIPPIGRGDIRNYIK